MIKVGINGFGRIGRFVFRAAQERNDIEIVGINDLCPVDYLAYMLKYDTMHGQFEGKVEADVEKNLLIVNGKKIRVTAEKDPANLKWDEVGAEYVVESTGLFLTSAFPLGWPWEAQSSPRVARESWGWRSSHCRVQETSPRRVSVHSRTRVIH